MSDLEVVQGKVFDVIGVADAAIAQMAEKYLPLTIAGIEDKAGYKAVHDARMVVKNTRVKVEKHGKEMREEAVKYQRSVIAEEKRIIALLEPIESHLTAEEKAVDDALEAIKQEAARKEAERLKQRIERLEAFGMGLRAGMYSILTINLPEALVKVCNDEQFDKFCSEIQAAIDAENKRIADEEEKRRAEEAERDRLRKEEEDRLAKVAADQDAERLRLEAMAREQHDKEVAAKATEEAEKRRKEMQDRLEQAERDKAATELKAEQDRLRREKEEWERIKADAIAEEERKKNIAIAEALHAEELAKAKAIAVEEARLQAIEDAKREAEEKRQAEEKERVAAERKAARAPDKVKILAVADILDAIQSPDVKTDDGKAVALKVMMDIQALIKEIRNLAGAL